MVGVSLASHTVAPICRVPRATLDRQCQTPKPVSFTKPRTSYVGVSLPSDGGKRADGKRDDRGLVVLASGTPGTTPTLHVGRLWLKQASKTGQGKQSATGHKTKGSCRRLCPPTATVAIETRPLLQKPFFPSTGVPDAMEMTKRDERSYVEEQNDPMPAHAAWVTYQAAIGDAHTRDEYALGISERLATLAEYRMIRDQSLLDLQAIRAAALGEQSNGEK